MNGFTIKDLENLSGIKAHTIRIWEQRYSFLKPQRTDTNIRYYSNEELKTILNISLLNKYGYKISQIDRMREDELNEKIISLSQIEAQQERLINQIIQYTVDADLIGFEKQLSSFIQLRGIEDTIKLIIFPFLERVGILWSTDHINPAQEHLITNIIRQKLIAGIDAIELPKEYKNTILLFLPEGEYHELGILFVHFLMKNKGVNVIYLGANVPVKDVSFVVNLKNPDFIYSHITSISNNFKFEKFLMNIHASVTETPIIISGSLAQGYKKKAPANIQFRTSLADMLAFIESL